MKDLETRKRFVKELEFYIAMSEREQDTRLNDHLPSVAGYIQTRMGSSAVRVILALIE
jgi:hypothetical protein